MTITQAALDVWDDGSYHIQQVMKRTEVPAEGGRIGKTTNLRRYAEWDDAMDALDWD